MVPATAENGDKITVQLAKIITIPAHQLAQCQLQTSAGANKAGVTATPTGLSLLGGPLAVRALAPGSQVMRLTVPTQAQPQTLVVSQPGSVSCAPTVSTASRMAVPAPPRIIGGVINGSELLIGGAGGVTLDKLKAMGIQVQAVQVPVMVHQNQVNPKTVLNLKSEALDAVVKPDSLNATKTEEPEC